MKRWLRSRECAATHPMGQKKCGTGTAAIVISKKRQCRNALSLFVSQYLYSNALLSLQHISPNDIIMMEIIPITLIGSGVMIMRTGMKKKDKVTEIYFNEADNIIVNIIGVVFYEKNTEVLAPLQIVYLCY